MERLSTAFYAGGVIAVAMECFAFFVEFWLNTGYRPLSIARAVREWIWSMGISSNKPLVLTVHGRVVVGAVGFVFGVAYMWFVSAPKDHVQE